MQFINTSNSATLIWPWLKNFCDSRSKLTSTSDKLSPCTLWTVHGHDNDDGKCILLMDSCCQFFVSPNPSWQILVPRTSPSNVPRTSPKDPIWQSWGRLELRSQGRPDLTSSGRLEMTSRGRPNLTFKGRPWKVNSGRLRTFSGRPLDDLENTS